MSENTTYTHYLKKAMQYCSHSEHCISDVEQKLWEWSAPPEIVQPVIENLQKENFICEKRYAKAFANDRFKFNGWGMLKIKTVLQHKNICRQYIQEAIDTIDPDTYEQMARELIRKKISQTKETNPLKKKQKVLRFLQSRGFESDIVLEILENCKGM